MGTAKLVWESVEHNRNLQTAIQQFRTENEFYDVTLACMGNYQIQAHQVSTKEFHPQIHEIEKVAHLISWSPKD